MTRAYSYFPGCSQVASGSAYDASTRAVARALELDLTELADWNCCGATPYAALREVSGYVLNARNLALAELAAPDADLVTPCTGCYTNLLKTNKAVHVDPGIRSAVDRSLAAGGMRYSGGIRARHLLQVFVEDVGVEAIEAKVVRPLSDLTVAPYYGCQLVRPYADGEDPDNPTALDRLLTALGATVVDFPAKTRCCGGMLMVSTEKVAVGLVDEVLGWARAREADCVATLCSLCFANLEGHQSGGPAVPVAYFTQLMGLALGLDPSALGIGSELVSLDRVMSTVGGQR